MKASMGIYDASLGNREGNQSGKAIIGQQQQASLGNFHFSDNFSRSLRHAGRIILEMCFTHPKKLYDTPRIMRILGDDGTPKTVKMDPRLPQAVAEQQTQAGKVEKVFNPTLGKYDVVVDTGPSYMTKRQEAVSAQLQLAQANPDVLKVAGDLIVREMDWPNADKIADRLKKALPPQLQDPPDGAAQQDPQLIQAEHQMQQMAQMMEHMAQEMQHLKDESLNKHREISTREYEAETHRMAVEAQIALLPGQLHKQAISNLQQQMSVVNPAMQDPELNQANQAQPPAANPAMQGAQTTPQQQPEPESNEEAQWQ